MTPLSPNPRLTCSDFIRVAKEGSQRRRMTGSAKGWAVGYVIVTSQKLLGTQSRDTAAQLRLLVMFFPTGACCALMSHSTHSISDAPR
jgi:hypothetical protein